MKILVINGPNLNFLGIREKGIYGTQDYNYLMSMLEDKAKNDNIMLETFQSNCEGTIIDRIQQALNPELEIIGVLRTMYDARNALTRDVSEELQQYFGKKLYDTVIPRNVRLAEAPAHGLPVIYFEKSSKGAVAYLNLAAEMLKKSKVKKGSNA